MIFFLRFPPWIPIQTLGLLLCKSKGTNEKTQDFVDSFPSPQPCFGGAESRWESHQIVPLQNHLLLSLLLCQSSWHEGCSFLCLIMPGKFLLFPFGFYLCFQFLVCCFNYRGESLIIGFVWPSVPGSSTVLSSLWNIMIFSQYSPPSTFTHFNTVAYALHGPRVFLFLTLHTKMKVMDYFAVLNASCSFESPREHFRNASLSGILISFAWGGSWALVLKRNKQNTSIADLINGQNWEPWVSG